MRYIFPIVIVVVILGLVAFLVGSLVIASRPADVQNLPTIIPTQSEPTPYPPLPSLYPGQVYKLISFKPVDVGDLLHAHYLVEVDGVSGPHLTVLPVQLVEDSGICSISFFRDPGGDPQKDYMIFSYNQSCH